MPIRVRLSPATILPWLFVSILIFGLPAAAVSAEDSVKSSPGQQGNRSVSAFEVHRDVRQLLKCVGQDARRFFAVAVPGQISLMRRDRNTARIGLTVCEAQQLSIHCFGVGHVSQIVRRGDDVDDVRDRLDHSCLLPLSASALKFAWTRSSTVAPFGNLSYSRRSPAEARSHLYAVGIEIVDENRDFPIIEPQAILRRRPT